MSHANHEAPEDAKPGRVSVANSALVAAAGVFVSILVGMTTLPQPIVDAQTGSLNGLSGMAASSADTALLTSDAGSDDVLIVLDQRGEELLVYQPDGTRGLEFKGRYGLRELFAEARLHAGIPATEPRPRRPSPEGVGNPVR